MFQQLKNLDSAFKHVRLFSFVMILASVIICCYAMFKSYAFVAEAQNRVYIISDGKAIEAFASSRKENIPVEARTHVQLFHQLFFVLSPDEKAIEANMRKAFYLADKSAKDQYDNLKERGYFSQVINANISQELMVDSISVYTDDYPYYFKFFGKQRIIRPTSIVTRNLITDGILRDLQTRTDHNPHGFLIEKWNTLDNSDITIQKR